MLLDKLREVEPQKFNRFMNVATITSAVVLSASKCFAIDAGGADALLITSFTTTTTTVMDAMKGILPLGLGCMGFKYAVIYGKGFFKVTAK